MDLCARHSREVETKLAMFPPIHKQYPLYTTSTDTLRQVNRLWTSPLLLHTLVSTYQRRMLKHALPLPYSVALGHGCNCAGHGIDQSVCTQSDIVAGAMPMLPTIHFHNKTQLSITREKYTHTHIRNWPTFWMDNYIHWFTDAAIHRFKYYTCMNLKSCWKAQSCAMHTNCSWFHTTRFQVRSRKIDQNN